MKTYTSPSGIIHPFYNRLLHQKHLMIAGASGSGKSVVLNGIIHTALARFPGYEAGCAQFIFIDLKGFELSMYASLPHTMAYAMSPKDAVTALKYAIQVIEHRNQQIRKLGLRQYPGGDVYVIIDEFADLMTMIGKQVTPLVQRIAQIGRAANVHIILCTQCPIAEVIPTKIKCNFESILALHTRNAQDSRNIIGVSGCERLPAHGSALYTEPGLDVTPVYGLPLITDEKLQARVDHWVSCQKSA